MKHIPDMFKFSDKLKKPWGTAHAVLSSAAEMVRGPFAVINADDYYGLLHRKFFSEIQNGFSYHAGSSNT